MIHSNNSGVFTRALRTVATGIVLLALIGHSLPQQAQQLLGVRVGLLAEQPTYPTHSPVYAVVSVQNGINEAIQFSFGHNSKSFGFSLTLPSGRTIDLPYPPEEGIGAFAVESLAPGQTYKQRVLINEWYEFATPGAYTIQLKTGAVFRTATGRNVQPLPIEKMVVAIGPRDDAQLVRVCRELLALALSDPSVQDRVDAANALSRIQDPVAIPYLKQILEKGVSVKEYGVRGLGRIGTKEATEVLIANLSIRDAEIQKMITRELKTIESSTMDQQLKERIRSGLDSLSIP